MKRIEIRGQSVDLLPEKLVYLPAQKTLLVADTHFGKAATFRKAGIPVPIGTTAMMLAKLTEVIRRTSATRLIFLGDFVHSSTQTKVDFTDELIAWRDQHETIGLTLVPGNHDRGFKNLATELKMDVQSEPLVQGAFSFCHFHQAGAETQKFTPQQFTFAGHVHPAVNIQESTNSSLKIPCFAIANDYMILPAFGEFTGCHVIKFSDYQQVIAVADNRLIKIESTSSRQSTR
jgi:DNA ligase-associated metallophosphoesterase